MVGLFLPALEVPTYSGILFTALLPILLPQLRDFLKPKCTMAGPVIPNLQHPKSNLLRLVPLDPPRPSHHTTPVRDWITWRSWKTCAVDMLNIPREMNTHDIYDAFNKYGNLISIDVWEDAAGRPDSKGRMRFK